MDLVKTTLPEEIKEQALKVPEEKQKEVLKVLTDIFNGTADWEKQVDKIVIKDINDKMSIDLADVARKNAKTARLNAEKVFDEKRSEVQLKMSDYKLEDSLWLKSKQIMQLKFKHIEEKAKYKADFVKIYETEQKELKTELRIEKIIKFKPEIERSEIENLSDEIFENVLSGLEKQYNDKIEAEKKAEEERIEQEKQLQIQRNRQLELAPYMVFIRKYDILLLKTEEEYQKEFKDIKEAKKQHEIRQEEIRVENERLKKEAEEKERKRITEEKTRLAKEEKERKLREEQERKQQEIYEANLKKEREEKAKLEAMIKDKKEVEEKAKEAELLRVQNELNKGDQDKVNDLIKDLSMLKTKYIFESQKNNKMYSKVNILIDKVINHIK